jgi:hypothetical protein
MLRVLTALMLLSALAVAAPVPRALKPKPPAGEWTIEFENGVVETCSIERSGKTAVSEPLRSSAGRAEVAAGGVLVLAFDDDRTERWTPDGDGFAVEHWCPSSRYPTATPVRGVARTTSQR